MQRVLYTLVFAVLFTGCTQFPELDAAVSEEAKNADYLDLVPSEQLLNRKHDSRLSEATGDALLARAERLKARARILRNITAVNDETRLRIADRLRRLGG